MDSNQQKVHLPGTTLERAFAKLVVDRDTLRQENAKLHEDYNRSRGALDNAMHEGCAWKEKAESAEASLAVAREALKRIEFPTCSQCDGEGEMP